MSAETSLENRVVVVTGAAGGLGRALVKNFLAERCNVAGIVRSRESYDTLQNEFDTEKFSVHIADVADPGQVSKAFEEIVNKYGRVDFLFNNAAVYPRVNFLDESAQEWLDAIAINLGGISNCTKSVLPVMINNGFGRIYNLSSFADIDPVANSVAYSCSKGGVHGLTKAIAADIANLSSDVEIHEWNPGHLNTRMSDYTGIDPEISSQWAVEIACGKIQATKKCTLFCENYEWQPPPSLKQRLKNKLLFWK